MIPMLDCEYLLRFHIHVWFKHFINKTLCKDELDVRFFIREFPNSLSDQL
jgi:hypothetical protein